MSWTNFFRFEIQHIFPIGAKEALSPENLEKIAALMGDEFDLTMQGNLIAMFADDVTARALQALPPAASVGWVLAPMPNPPTHPPPTLF